MSKGTGATDEQIEMATKRKHDRYRFMPPRVIAEQLSSDAPFLVPPDHRIVSVGDLQTLLDGWDGAASEFGGDDGSMDHIRALIGGATEGNSGER